MDNWTLTLDEYQRQAARTINCNLHDSQIEAHALHEMAAEVGEIHGLYQKALQGHGIDDEALVLEVGDLLWGIAELCTVKNWSLSVVAERNILKLRRRYPDGFTTERSVNREGDENG